MPGSSFVKENIYFLIIYFLAAWVLVAAHRIYSCGIQILHCSMCDLAPDQELNLSPLHWKPGGLAIEPPGTSLASLFGGVFLSRGYLSVRSTLNGMLGGLTSSLWCFLPPSLLICP